MVVYMSVYALSSRVSSVEYSVDELGRKADSFNAVLSGTTTINGPAFLNGPVALGSSITGIDISDVSGLQTSLDDKADKTNTYTKGDVDLNISNLIASAPEALNTLNELAQALASDPNHATTVFNQLATKASIEYVDEKFALKANQSTTYTKTETDDLLTPKSNNCICR